MLCISICRAETIEFIVSASPGGPNDTVSRRLVERIEKSTSLQIAVFNKPGAAHTIAYTHVLNTNKPTLIMSTPEIINHEVYTHLDEIYNTGYFTNTLFVSEKSGIKSVKQLVELANTREILFGHGGIGTYSHMAMETFCKSIKCLGVPYRSGADGMLALMSNQIDAYALVSYGAYQFSENNKVVPIYTIRTKKDNSWFKLFAKNISAKDKDAIISVLKSQDPKFYTDMGFEK